MVTGDELAAADRWRRARMLRDADVVARVAPEQKLQVVEALRDAGRVVGLVGDAANGATAIRADGDRIARTRPATTPSPPIAAGGTKAGPGGTAWVEANTMAKSGVVDDGEDG